MPFLLLLLALMAAPLRAQVNDSTVAQVVGGLRLRSIGPALMGGRIADIAVHPTRPGTWYVAAGSGGVWKTTNAGTSWSPIFDDQPSYSIGEITLDPSNPEVVWVGTGENVSGRHVGWGDGVYRSRDGGRTWQRMGLANSQHIGRILVDPRNSQVVLVAAEGPLWSAGGERGVFRTTDGGVTWSPMLTIDEHTGVTDLEFDPANPDVVYAAAYQRRRHVWGFQAGGPSSGIWKSTDNGVTWRQVRTGLPTGDVGKIGLTVTPADPSRVYATLEAHPNERGFYRSLDRGESWEKRNSYLSGGTGPHYYQELEASPIDPDVVYQMDVFLHVTRDGGGTFNRAETGSGKHSDNHALVIDPANPRHLIVGTDGGLYESFDEGETWRHFPNLPVSQLYKVALSSREPFYDVLAGAQDLGTLHGPSRTTNRDGIRSQDWYVPLGADGYGVAFDPTDPDRLYLMWQQGMLYRRDRRNEETLSIRPEPDAADAPERWNWDAPLLVSPHDPSRLYYGSQRLWRSDDRGNSWRAVSGDLTLAKNRYEMPFMGRVPGVDALFDHGAMSKYATTTAVSESPLREGTLAVGTDDGLVQVTTDGGASWARAAAPPGLPALSYVNDVEMSLHEPTTLYLAADNHKQGDFAPYLFESRDLGRTWRSIAGNLPRGTIVWAMQQDHVQPNLLFAATESGIYVTVDRGLRWHRLGAGVPTISFRDLKLHRRDNDLVGASFGRGICVLDDYTPLRALAAGAGGSDATLFPVRNAWWFVPWQPGQAPGRPELGTDDFRTPNPPHGVLLTYHLREAFSTEREARQARDRGLRSRGADVPFPGVDRLRAESRAPSPLVMIRIASPDGAVVRWLEGPSAAGLHRVAWDLRGPSPDPIDLRPRGWSPPWDDPPTGPLAPPGRYTAQLVVVSPAGARTLGEPQAFEVRTGPGLLAGTDPLVVARFQQQTAEARRQVSALGAEVARWQDQLRHMRAALAQTPNAEPALHAAIDSTAGRVAELGDRLSGDPARARLDEPDRPSVTERIWSIAGGHWATTQMPTATQQRDLALATAAIGEVAAALDALVRTELARLEAALERAGAPWTPARRRVP